MGLEQRPYVGTWSLSGKTLIQSTPDVLVYLNGDLSLPGCPKCNGKIEVQRFITEVSVDAGVDAAAASATISLSIPVHHTDAIVRDARFVFHPGLEVHIYMRGYFPAKGMYSNLAEQRSVEKGEDDWKVSGEAPDTRVVSVEHKSAKDVPIPKGKPIYNDEGKIVGYSLTREQVNEWGAKLGRNEDQMTAVLVVHSETGSSDPEHRTGEREIIVHSLFNRKTTGYQCTKGESVWNVANGNKTTTGKQGGQRNYATSRIPSGADFDKAAAIVDRVLEQRVSGESIGGGTLSFIHQSSQSAVSSMTGSEKRAQWISGGLTALNGPSVNFQPFSSKNYPVDPLDAKIDAQKSQTSLKKVVTVTPKTDPNKVKGPNNTEVILTPSVLQEMNLQGYDLENLLAYPYYHVFHGIVTSTSINWSGGTQQLSLQCASMLHFWNYHRMSTNASIFGARPSNSKLKVSMVGHNFTGMHPYEIIYYLHNDMVGAAAGVSWAMGQKTSHDAVSGTGESLWSLNQRYWQARFKTSMVQLRLHGVTGELFSAAQASWLSRASSSQLTKLMKARFGKVKGGPQGSGSIFSQATSLGLFNKKKSTTLESLVVIGQASEGKKNNMELVLPEMQAFVSNISNWGQINLFESSYESKLDVANAVVEVTGFEFYQDVDGDFVFKPPMYNLDTQGSRVYCIEDIDIISISFEEKEPEVTYMTGKGEQFKLLTGTGTENEWGVQGQYIDYRLVAQFGWRPGSFETAYFNDPKAIFYAAVNRMDVLNAPVNSASLTIPVRPELRPGYPVYIRYLDCYYYCPSFAHSHSVGGQCNTSLQLIAKRAKFFAPGKSPKIEDIDLGRPDLPPMPLEVLDEAGLPRLSGFPNVVMALDPNEVNPLFFIIGSEVEGFNDRRVLEKIVEIAVMQNILTEVPDQNGKVVGYLMAQEPEKPPVYFTFGQLPENSTGSKYQKFDLLEEGNKKAAQDAAIAKVIRKEEKSLRQIDAEIAGWNRMMASISKTTPEGIKRRAEVQKSINRLAAKREAQVAEVNSAAENFRKKVGGVASSGIAYLEELYQKVSDAFLAERRKDGGDFGNLNSTVALLDMLADKKSVFTNNTLPGTYRYYSCSHPVPSQQGQPQATLTESTSTVKGGTKLTPKPVSSRWQGQEVTSYLNTPEIMIPEGRSRRPGAQLGKKKPKLGIHVMTSSDPKGDVIPTSEVRELMFSKHIIKAQHHQTSTRRSIQVGSLGSAFVGALKAKAQKISKPGLGVSTSMTLVYQTFFPELATAMNKAVTKAKSKFTSAKDNAVPSKIPNIAKPVMPSSIIIQGGVIQSSMDVSKLILFDNPAPEGGVKLFTGCTTTPTKQFWKLVDTALSQNVAAQVDRAVKDWVLVMGSNGLTHAQRQQALNGFNQQLTGTYGAAVKGTTSVKTEVVEPKNTTVQTPVFPVSDDRGYEVIGSYRYGRGVSIDADGVFDRLHRTDPLSLLDKKTVDALVDFYVRGMSPSKWITKYVGTSKTSGGGGKARKSVSPTGAGVATEVETQVLRQLRAVLTDQQILDLGFATIGKNPTMLTLNMKNWFADKGKEGIHKLPINNAAYSLADLTIHTSKRGCDCKSAEADVLLEAAGQTDFVQFTDPGTSVPQGYPTGTESKATQWLVTAAARASVAWKQSQDALRGTVIDRNTTSIVSSLLSAGDQLKDTQKKLWAQAESLNDAAAQRADIAATTVREPLKGK